MPVYAQGKICPRNPEALDAAPRPRVDNAMVKALARAFRWRKLLDTGVQDAELRSRRDLLLSVVGVGETLAGLLIAELPEPGALRRSSEVVAYAGLNPEPPPIRQVDRPPDPNIEDRQSCAAVGTLYAGAGGDALQPRGSRLAARLKTAGRLKPKQIVVAAMRNRDGA